MSNYIILMGYLDQLAREVSDHMSDGYVPTGGPVLGEQGISEPKYMQAMYRPDRVIDTGRRGEVGDCWPTTQELEDAVHEANAVRPGSASMGSPRPSSDHSQVTIQTITDRETFLKLPLSEMEALVQTAEAHFRDVLSRLRDKQQQPYMEFSTPKLPDGMFDQLTLLIKASNGVNAEYEAAVRARDPNAKPVMTFDLVDAQLIDALLESTHAQYPTEHQEAVLRFKRAVHGTQES